MSDPEDNQEPEKDPPAEPSINPPKVRDLPNPDKFHKSSADSAVVNARERAKAEKRRKKKKNKERSHPLDGFAPLKKNREGKGCFGCTLALLTTLFVGTIAAIVIFYWWAIAPYKEAGYEIVSENENGLAVIEEAPVIESVIFVWEVEYLAESTPKPIVFVGDTVTLSGTFEDKVSFRGRKLILEPGAVFKKDLEVFGVTMINRGATVEGETLGSVMSQTNEEPDDPSGEPEEETAPDDPTG